MNTMKFIIRNAVQNDLPSIMKLFEKKGEYPLSSPGKEMRELFSAMLSDTSRYIFVGEKNDIISAFISMRIEPRFENLFKFSAFITDIRADGDSANILTAVLSRATAVAMENSCSEIIISDKNVTSQSQAVYSICGFCGNNTFFTKKL